MTVQRNRCKEKCDLHICVSRYQRQQQYTEVSQKKETVIIAQIKFKCYVAKLVENNASTIQPFTLCFMSTNGSLFLQKEIFATTVLTSLIDFITSISFYCRNGVLGIRKKGTGSVSSCITLLLFFPS